MTDRQNRLLCGIWQLFGFIILSLLVACSGVAGSPGVKSSPPKTSPTPLLQSGSCTLDLSPDLTDQQKIVALLQAEGTYLVEQDITALMRLWAIDGRICDAKHTSLDPSDDHIWEGADAIRHRYLYRVFPGNPASVELLPPTISLNSDTAIVSSTTSINDEFSPGGDRWLIEKEGNCWLIRELVFNLENPNPTDGTGPE